MYQLLWEKGGIVISGLLMFYIVKYFGVFRLSVVIIFPGIVVLKIPSRFSRYFFFPEKQKI